MTRNSYTFRLHTGICLWPPSHHNLATVLCLRSLRGLLLLEERFVIRRWSGCLSSWSLASSIVGPVRQNVGEVKLTGPSSPAPTSARDVKQWALSIKISAQVHGKRSTALAHGVERRLSCFVTTLNTNQATEQARNCSLRNNECTNFLLGR